MVHLKTVTFKGKSAVFSSYWILIADLFPLLKFTFSQIRITLWRVKKILLFQCHALRMTSNWVTVNPRGEKMKTQSRSRILVDEPDDYVAVSKDGVLVGTTVGWSISTELNGWVQRYIEMGNTIYRVERELVVRYMGEKIPSEILARLELAVTAVLEGK